MNEREFIEFYRYLAEKVRLSKQDNKAKEVELKAKFDQEYLINVMWEVLAMIESQGHALTRVSMHAINFHFLCFDRRIWRSGRLSVVSSIDVSLQMAGGYDKTNFTDIMDDLSRLRFNLPESLVIKTKLGELRKTREDLINDPVFSFEYSNF